MKTGHPATPETASRRREDRVIAGDAAHVHSPAGGQGMNTGIQDAVVLAKAIAAARGGDPAALDGYEQQRRPVAKEVVRTADRLTALATIPSWRRPMRDTALALAGALPLVPRRIARQLSGLAYR